MPTRYLGGEVWVETMGSGPVGERSFSWDVAGRWLQALYETPLLFTGILDAAGIVLDGNELSIEGCGHDRADTVGRPFWEGGWWRPEPALADRVRRWCTEVAESGRVFRTATQYYLADGSMRMVDLTLHPVHDDHPSGARRTYLVAYGLDVTETLAARADRETRLQREAEEFEQLARTRDAELVATAQAEHLVRIRLAQLAGAAVDMVGADTIEELTSIVFNAAFPMLDAVGGAVLVREEDELLVYLSDHMDDLTRQKYTLAPLDSPLPGRYVARTGMRLLFPDQSAGLAFLPEMAGVYEDTGRKAWAYFPLERSGRLLGSLAISWRDERDFTPEEIGLMESIAAQCAQVVDRIRITRAEAEHAAQVAGMVESMQRSLLTSSPTSDRLDVATLYLPAAEAVQVGGDWYDAFTTRDGVSLLVVGDVAGHDGDAAATMAQLRNLFRGMAFHGAHSPARLLSMLDEAIVALGLDAMATVLVVEIQPPGPSGHATVRWASAGHPPPVLRHADGTAALLEERGQLLLGAVVGAPRSDHRFELPPGSALLLYTDGLVERRAESLADRLERLRGVVAATPTGDLQEFCSAVVASMVPDLPEDDVVVLGVRSRGDGTSPETGTFAPGHRGTSGAY